MRKLPDDVAEEIDATTFANVGIYDCAMLDDMEDDWLLRNGWPQGNGHGRADSAKPRRKR